MKWLELSIRTPPEFVEPLSQIFHRYGHGGVAVEEAGGFNPDEGESQPPQSEVVVRTYLPVDSTTDDRRSKIDLGVQLVRHVAPISRLDERVIDEEDWQESWKQHFDVLHIGRRVVICPTWREYEAGPSDIVVYLDPGMAFGTGHHPTTRMCLEALEAVVIPGCRVLDVGCGSGILAIAAAKMGAQNVICMEIDETAARVAAENVRHNGVEDKIRVFHGTLPATQAEKGGFDFVLANISANVLSDLAVELAGAIRSGGGAIVSGIIGERRDAVVAELGKAGLIVASESVDEDWIMLICDRN